MQRSVHGADLARDASVVLRIGGAVFGACPSDRLRSLYYRVDAGARAAWRHLRGSAPHPGVGQDAQQANIELWERASALPLPAEFLTGYRDLATAALVRLYHDETVMSRAETAARAIETVGFLEAGREGAAGAVDFERSCQASSDSLLEGWAEDPLPVLRRLRRQTDVWALAYQRFAGPGHGPGHDTVD
ncbi:MULTISPECIES: hypothetical protein [unclassified Streptomyces]|uniref:hypothetical protein n=1 Tax=unclassified Streptomyces TaxID=2593676 RepID=UPI0024420257|nr:hypothetical protein [Streptomyces sp. DH41]MDG9721344.1 hypothetical protein [Streptomyces sp. DH41]